MAKKTKQRNAVTVAAPQALIRECRNAAEAMAMDVSLAAWIRQAMREKLARDAKAKEAA